MSQIEFGQLLLFSCDIDLDLATHSKKTFSFDTRVHIFHKSGPDMLRDILPKLPLHAPIFYWLDSHMCREDYNLDGQPLLPRQGDPLIRFPIWEEVNIIKDLRINRGAKDFILIDDAMLYDELDRYEDRVERLGPGAVPPEHRKLLPKIIDLFKNTHKSQVITIAQGFLALHPL